MFHDFNRSALLLGVAINRGSYMSAHVLLNLLKELGKRDLINSIIQEHEC